MGINNFESIEELLSWNSDDEFYFVQVLKRKKENPELGSNSYVVKTYYINSLEHLRYHKEEMIALAKLHNARVYINLNKRSYEKCALQTARLILEQVLNKDFKSSRKAFNSVCGKYNADSDKKWIIDVDVHDPDGNFRESLGRELKQLQPYGDKIYSTIPTKNGFHLITSPFNISQFNDLYGKWASMEKPDIHKNNPTILFIP